MTTPALARREATPRRPSRRDPAPGARWWSLLAAALIAWSLWATGVGRGQVLNPAGWPSLRAVAEAAIRPDLSADFLLRTLDAAAITVAFSLLGTVLATAIGLVGGVLMSEAWWRAAPVSAAGSARHRRAGWGLTRIGFGLPRGVHEAVWGIGLLMVLGRDPLVGILALAIPFGAITAKVFAEIIDETPSGPHDALISAGAGRVEAFCYGTLPRIGGDLIAYAFYRFDCALRSAVILGMIGVGGLGFELTTAFAGLNYERMWTLIYVLILSGLLFDRWSASLRRSGASLESVDSGTRARTGARRHRSDTAEGAGWTRASLGLGVLLSLASIAYLRLDLARLLEARTWQRAGEMIAAALPPSLPSTWADLAADAAATVQMSVVAIVVGSLLGSFAAFVGAPGPGAGPLRRLVAMLCRLVLLSIRAVSPPVWALLLLFVVLPGPVPGALALGLYNAGVLGRLFTETLETMDRRPIEALHQLGAGPVQTFCYGVVPTVTGRFTAYALYRWEVTIRETVVVGVVGAGGLGRVLESQRAAFDYSSMLTVVIALLLLSLLVDAASASARRAWR